MSRPLLGTQAADNAAWDEIAAALASTDVAIDGVVGRLDNDAAQDLVAAVTPVLVRLVDQAVAAAVTRCGHNLIAARAEGDDAVYALARRWLDATWEQMQ